MKHERHTVDCEPANPGYVSAFLRIAGDECAFVECYTTHALPHLLAALEAHGKKPEQVRYVVVTHAHLDHAGGASALMKACPNATLLAHPRAARHLVAPEKLVASATAVYGEETFRRTYGTIEPIPEARVRTLGEGETFALGASTLRVFHTEGHARHHFVVHDPDTRTVYTGDTFGLVYPRLQRGGTFAFASTSPTDFDASAAYASIDKVLSLAEPTASPTHFGDVTNVEEVAAQVRRFIARSEELVVREAATTASVADIQARIESDLRVVFDDAAKAAGLLLDAEDWASLTLDLTLNAQGLAFAADKRRKAS